MTIRHHPTDETLAAFAGATLDEGNSLVVATHLAHCSTCRELVRQFSAVAGALIEETVDRGLEISQDTRVRLMERIVGAAQLKTPVRLESGGNNTPSRLPLALYEDGQWRRVGLGVHWKPLAVDASGGTRVFMLRAEPGTRLPDHRHVGTEWTCVLEGAFSHQLGRFGPGDFDEADDSIDHSPFVEREGPCICLVALNGRIELKSWIGRIIQPFVNI